MPEGFEKQVSSDEFANLLAFLAERGKYLPVPLDKVATVDSTHGMFNDVNNDEKIVFDDWSPKTVQGVPFNLTRPSGEHSRNAILLHSTQGTVPPTMPKTVELPCNSPARAIHILGGVSGWGFPSMPKGTTSLIVRLHYADGKTEDHPLVNGEQLADYVGSQEVPGSKLAFKLGDKQVRYLAIEPEAAGKNQHDRTLEERRLRQHGADRDGRDRSKQCSRRKHRRQPTPRRASKGPARRSIIRLLRQSNSNSDQGKARLFKLSFAV